MNKPKLTILSATVAALAAVSQLNAQVLFSDNFSSHNNGDIDANESGGPNQAPNGGPGNPWWGPNPGNLTIATTLGGINPYPGDTKLAGGVSNGGDVDYYNMAYRLNGGANFAGNIALSWAFYDPSGAGGNDANYQDIGMLEGFQAADGFTSTKDYTGSGPWLNASYTSGDQFLELGAVGGFNSTVYQARIIGASANTDGATSQGGGYFNLAVPRTVGWHTAEIVLGAPNGANTTVNMYIDGTDVLTETMNTTLGVNTVGFDSGVGSVAGAFDSVVVSEVPEPGTVSLLVCGGLACLGQWRRSRK